MAKPNPKIPEIVKATVNPTPMQMVDEQGIIELIGIAQSGVDGGTENSKAILEALRGDIKSDKPKPILGALKVIEELMRNCTRKFHLQISSEEWTRRLGKLVYNSNEKIIQMTVLQLFADWREAYKNDPELSGIVDKCAELAKAGHSVPQPSPELSPKRELKNQPKGGYEERISRLIDASPMASLDEEGIQELCLLVIATDEVGVTAVLKALKPRVKDLKHPKQCLAGLTIMDELVKRGGNAVHLQIATDDWMNRLLKLHDTASEGVIKMKILQLLVNWREMFKAKPDLGAVARICAKLFASGVTLPPVTDTSLQAGTMSTAQMVQAGKAVQLSDSQKANPDGSQTKREIRTDSKYATMYTCHDDSDFGSVHWTLDLLLQSSSAADHVWNPIEAVRGCDATQFVSRLAEVGIVGPPSTAGGSSVTVQQTAGTGGEEVAGPSSGEIARLKQQEQFWKNKASALEAKLKHQVTSPVKVKEYKVATDEPDLGAKNLEMQQLVDDLQQQIKTITEAKEIGASGEIKLLQRELSDLKDQNAEMRKKLKSSEQQVADALASAEMAAKGGSSASQALEAQLKKESAAKRELEAEIEEIKAAMTKLQTSLSEKSALAGEAKQAQQSAAQLQATIDSQELELNKEKRKVEELELELDMLNAEKAQLSAKVSKVSGAKFTSLAIQAKSAAADLKSNHKSLRAFAKDAWKQMSVDIGTVESTLVQQLKLSESLVGGAIREREELRAMYRTECKKRKKLYNQLQDMQGNLRVYCRMRPIKAAEAAIQGDFQIAATNEDNDELRIIERDGKGVGKRKFEFDNVFMPGTTQEQVFAQVEPLIESVLDGYNVCIFAYGQTGSGKTWTMEGIPEQPGISLRAVQAVFAQLKAREEEEESEVSLSMFEVYNEELKDLLDPQKKKMDMIMTKDEGLVISNLVKQPVADSAAVSTALMLGQKNRAVQATNMNEHSSRSHLILRLYLKLINKTSRDVTQSKLSLVDLAGSERVGKSGAEGQAMKEAQGINGSLSALGNVIRALATGTGHVPYRNSKLTHALSDSIGGDAKTLMFCNISPRELDIPETLCSIQFAVQAKEVKSGPAKKHTKKGEGEGEEGGEGAPAVAKPAATKPAAKPAGKK